MYRKSLGVVDIMEVFTSGGCLGSLQEWWVTRKSSRMVGD